MDYEPEDVARKALAMPGALSDRLLMISADFEARLPGYSQAVDRLVARLRASNATAGAPAVGDVFPDFILPDAQGHLWHLADSVGRGPLVLSFHRGYWCDFCHLNMKVLTEISTRLAELGCEIVAITPQNAHDAGRLARDAGAPFSVLCDVGLGVSTMLGLSYVVDDDLRHELAVLQVDLDAANLGHGWLMPITASFVLDHQGRITSRHIDPDPRLRMDEAAILQAAADVQSAARS